MMNMNFKSVPFIRLSGKWLNEAGFGIGSSFVAEVIENKIVLIKKDKGNEPKKLQKLCSYGEINYDD